MRRIVIALAVLFTAISSYAQHSVQVDDGAGRIAIIKAPTTGPTGVVNFTLPAGGGTLLTSGSISGLAWLTTGNTLTGTLPGSPVEFFGSINAADVIMKTTNTERLRILSSGGIRLSSLGTGIVHSDASGNLTSSPVVIGEVAPGAINTILVTNSLGATEWKALQVTATYLAGNGVTSPLNALVGDVTTSTTALTIGGTGRTLGANITINIADAAADGSTKGIASFTAADFNSAAGIISIDYTNGQSASGSTKGFLTSANWTTFNDKVTSVSGTANRISIGGTTQNPTVDIAGTYVGQSSITTLGTIGSGTWNGTAVGSNYGGTGKVNTDLVTNAGKALVVNGTENGYVLTTLTTGTVTNVSGTSPISVTNPTTTPNISIANAAADGSTKGAASFTANDFNASSGNISLDYTNGQLATAAQNGFLSSTDWTTFNNKLTTVTADAPLSGSGTAGSHLVIANAAADGSTKGAASFTAADFNASSGNISLDYANGQLATAAQNGFLSSTDWTTFNNKVTSVSGTASRITIGGTTQNPTVDIAGTYVGQSSITTLGTIGTGTWNGTAVGSNYGGTGKVNTDLVTNAGKALVVNATENGYVFTTLTTGTVTNVSGTSPISVTNPTTTPNISIANAAADGSTKGAASFTTNDFNATSGNISLDYTNGQLATAAQNGFLSSANWTTFNNKQNALTFGDLTSSDITVTGGTGAVIGSGATLTIANDAVTFAKMQNITNDRLLGRYAGSGGDMQEVTIGSGLSLSVGGVLSVSTPSAWALTGNAGTTAGTDFVGTTDAIALHIYVNSGTDNSLILNTNGSIQRDNAGDPRGTNAVDMQLGRSAVIQVASGNYSTIGGGRNNKATGIGSFVGGGGYNDTVVAGNSASGIASTVGGGYNNTALVKYTTVGGGNSNFASENSATIGGGQNNTAGGDFSFVGGGLQNSASGRGSVVSGGGWQGTNAFPNIASGNASTIGGGLDNAASGIASTIGGGSSNQAITDRATVGGGNLNSAIGVASTIGGGLDNAAHGIVSTIGGGSSNIASGGSSTIAGGNDLLASGDYSAIGGGLWNQATAEHAVVAGGVSNTASGVRSAVGGGQANSATNAGSFVGGGGWDGTTTAGNTAAGIASTVGGGLNNTALVNYTTVAGGKDNLASEAVATVGGGLGNTAGGDYSVVSGGRTNSSSGRGSVVSGGGWDGLTISGNTASGNASAIGGGLSNTAVGDYSSVPGGRGLTLDASADGSFGYLANTAGTNNMTISTANTAVFGNADLWLANNNSTPSALMFYESYGTTGVFPNTAQYVALKSPAALTATQTYELPVDYPSSNGQALVSTTGGAMSWVTVGAGTVTNVTATLPLSSSGGATPNISMTQSNTTTNGWLSMGDWNTFSGKMSQVYIGPSTPITGAGTSGDPLVMAQANGTTNGYLHKNDWTTFNGKMSQVYIGPSTPITGAGTSGDPLVMAQANGTTNGYLHKNDWTTFNNKLSSVYVTAPITGDGTIGNPLAMAAASGSVDGYLTSGNFTTFSNKLTTVSVTAPITGNGTGGNPLAMAAATSSASGYLTSADWTTFNNKQDAITTGALSGTAPVSVTGGGTVIGSATTISVATMVGSGASAAAGIVPTPPASAGTTKFLREDGTWVAPAGTVTTPISFSGGFDNDLGSGQTRYTYINLIANTDNVTTTRDYICPVAFTITGLYVITTVAPDRTAAAESVTFDILNVTAATNSGDVTISETAISGSNSSLGFSVAVGDLITLRSVTTNDPENGSEYRYIITATIP